MTKTIVFALLAALSLSAQGQDTTEQRLKRLESDLDLTVRVTYASAVEIERLGAKVALLEKESRRDNILIEGLIGDVIELRKRAK